MGQRLNFENYIFLPVMVSEAEQSREAEERVEPSRECLLDHAASGSSTETVSFGAQQF